MSGTTSISVLFCGDEVYVSNVGDSRAIIAQENLKASTIAGEANLVAKPLSIDQTPFRKVRCRSLPLLSSSPFLEEEGRTARGLTDWRTCLLAG